MGLLVTSMVLGGGLGHGKTISQKVLPNYNCSLRSNSSKYSRPRLADPEGPRLRPSSPPPRATNSKTGNTDVFPVAICAWGRARTADPFLFREMLYQLSYPSKWHYSILFDQLYQGV